MAMDVDSFADILKGIFSAMRGAASDEPKDDDWYAEQLAAAITDHVKTADVKAGISVSGGTASGGNLIGCSTSAKGVIE